MDSSDQQRDLGSSVQYVSIYLPLSAWYVLEKAAFSRQGNKFLVFYRTWELSEINVLLNEIVNCDDDRSVSGRRMKWECRALVEYYWCGNTEVLGIKLFTSCFTLVGLVSNSSLRNEKAVAWHVYVKPEFYYRDLEYVPFVLILRLINPINKFISHPFKIHLNIIL